ncbi:MAG: FkbM family methyltransferase [Candidatus Liptonbacteria bacterium]|nr:FkbM family methyltransferase [Candidatus Liptonbacteria bacterium]
MSPLVKARTFWGDRMKVSFPDNLAIYHYGVLDGQEIQVTNFIVDNLKEGDTFLDAGAHTGYYSLLASKIVGPRGSVHAFEPTPRTFGILKDNVASSARYNVILNEKALLEKQRTAEFADFGVRHGGLNSVLDLKELPKEFAELKEKEGLDIHKFRAEGIGLDEYCRERKVRPDLIKIDVEGAEYLLLSGAQDILRNYHPPLVIEIWDNEGRADNLKKVVSFLKILSYRPYQLANDLSLKPYRDGDGVDYDNFVFLWDKNRG